MSGKVASKIYQTLIFSKAPLLGFFKYKDIFQILPPEKQNEPHQHHNPLTLEFSYHPNLYPGRAESLWHRDIWEEERFEYIKRRSTGGKMDPGDPWVEAYQKSTEMLRLPAIIQEICQLLTTFSKYRFFTYDSEQNWFIPLCTDYKTGTAQSSLPAFCTSFSRLVRKIFKVPNRLSGRSATWGQKGYIPDMKIEGDIQDFTEASCSQLPMIQNKEYVKRFRDTIGYTKVHQIDFPDCIDGFFDLYFSLSSVKKSAFYMACHLYNKALFFQHSIPSLALVSSVMAVEKLMNYEEEKLDSCKECGAPESIEKCSSCGTPIYRLRSRFREFMLKYSLPDQDALYRQMYDVRSRLSHGGLLREDLFDTGFYAGSEKDNEDRLKRNSLISVHDALLHWLIENRS